MSEERGHPKDEYFVLLESEFNGPQVRYGTTSSHRLVAEFLSQESSVLAHGSETYGLRMAQDVTDFLNGAALHHCKPPLGNPTREEAMEEVVRLSEELSWIQILRDAHATKDRTIGDLRSRIAAFESEHGPARRACRNCGQRKDVCFEKPVGVACCRNCDHSPAASASSEVGRCPGACGLPSNPDPAYSPWCCSGCANYNHSRGYGIECTGNTRTAPKASESEAIPPCPLCDHATQHRKQVTTLYETVKYDGSCEEKNCFCLVEFRDRALAKIAEAERRAEARVERAETSVKEWQRKWRALWNKNVTANETINRLKTQLAAASSLDETIGILHKAGARCIHVHAEHAGTEYVECLAQDLLESLSQRPVVSAEVREKVVATLYAFLNDYDVSVPSGERELTPIAGWANRIIALLTPSSGDGGAK